MKKDSKKSIKDFPVTPLNEEETKQVKGGDGVVEEDIIN